MVCQKKTFRVETNIVRCEKYKPKGKTYKLVKQAEKNDRGTSPPPSRTHSMGTSTSPIKSHVQTAARFGGKDTQPLTRQEIKVNEAIKKIEDREKGLLPKIYDDDDIAFDNGKHLKEVRQEMMQDLARKSVKKSIATLTKNKSILKKKSFALTKKKKKKSKPVPKPPAPPAASVAAAPKQSLLNRIRGMR